MATVTNQRPVTPPPAPGADAAVQDQMTQQKLDGEQKQTKGKELEPEADAKAKAKTAKGKEKDPGSDVALGDGAAKAKTALFALDEVSKTPEEALAKLALLGEAPMVQAPVADARERSDAVAGFSRLAEKIDPSAVPDADKVAPPFSPDLPALALSELPAVSQDAPTVWHAVQHLEGEGKLHVRTPEQARRLELIKAFTKIMDAQAAKTETKKAEGALQWMPERFMQKAKEVSPKIAEAVRAFYGTTFTKSFRFSSGELEDRILHGDVPVIPDATVLAIENQLKPLHAVALEIAHEWEIGKAKPHLELVKKWGAAKDWKIGVAKDPLKLKMAIVGGGDGGGNGGGGTSGTGGGGGYINFGGSLQGGFMAMMAGADIETLIIIVMMNSTKIEDDLLRDLMKQMQATNAKKKAMRELKTRMKQDEARLGSEMQNEYNDLVSKGLVHSTITFEEYKAWRQCQWASLNEDADGNMQYAPPQLAPLPPIPEWMRAGHVPPTNETDESGGVSGAGTKYGFDAALEEQLKKLWDSMPPETRGASFEEWLGATFKTPVTSKDDIIANLNKANEVITAERDRATASGGAIPVEALGDPNSDAYKKANKLSQEIMALMILEQTGSSVTNELTNKRAELAALMGNVAGTPEQIATAMKSIMGAALDAVKKDWAMMKDWMNDFHNEPLKTVAYCNAMDMSDPDHYGGYWTDSYDSGGPWADPEDCFANGGEGGFQEQGIDGGSKEGKNEWGGDGFTGTGTYHEEDDEDTSGTIKARYKPPGGGIADFMCDMMGEFGGTIDRGEIGAIDSLLSSFANGLAGADPLAAIAVTMPEGTTPPLTPEEYDAMLGTVGGYLADAQNPDSQYSKWIYDNDVDGAKTREAEEKAAAEEAARKKAEEAARNKSQGGRMATEVPLNQTGNLEQFTAFCAQIDDKLASLSEMSELDALRLQTMMDRRSKLLETLSNLIKKLSTTDGTISANQK
ncbi:MAG: hypothetical protein IT381_19745 [Deltaproteobacteria bacterium]|nr:hypothetical protein [Deltaproteobacteria bacterium]